jgi:hypothetical protein
LKYIARFPFIAVAEIDGDPPYDVVLLDNTLLSLHAVTGEDPVSVDLSSASNHNTHPGTLLGSKFQMLLDVDVDIT